VNSAGGENTALLDDVKLAVASNPPTTPTLSNSGFETPPQGGGGYTYNPAAATWAFTGDAGLAGNFSGFTAANPAAPEGQQVAFLQRLGMISQTVTLNAGTYTLSLQAAQRGNFQSAQQDFQVKIDNQVVATFTPSGTTYSTLVTPTFTVATTGSHTITFVGLNSAGGENTALLDDVKLALAT
jgi:hypothetical protein